MELDRINRMDWIQKSEARLQESEKIFHHEDRKDMKRMYTRRKKSGVGIQNIHRKERMDRKERMEDSPAESRKRKVSEKNVHRTVRNNIDLSPRPSVSARSLLHLSFRLRNQTGSTG